MELKDYQKHCINEVKVYLEHLATFRAIAEFLHQGAYGWRQNPAGNPCDRPFPCPRW